MRETEIERTPITQNDCHLEREGGKRVHVGGGGELEVQEQTGGTGESICYIPCLPL